MSLGNQSPKPATPVKEPAKAVHVLRLERVVTKTGNQGADAGFFLPKCSCGWASESGIDWGSTEAARAAWELALYHARAVRRGAV